jgi:hypothetical protein
MSYFFCLCETWQLSRTLHLSIQTTDAIDVKPQENRDPCGFESTLQPALTNLRPRFPHGSAYSVGRCQNWRLRDDKEWFAKEFGGVCVVGWREGGDGVVDVTLSGRSGMLFDFSLYLHLIVVQP